jgi:PAT family beta-lactamase induction signal transducer AmpG
MFPSRTARYAMFGLVYFAEGAILSYFTALNSLYLLSFNLSMSQVGLIGMIALIPFVIKIFFGMLSDRFNFLRLGFRKPYIILGLLVQCLCLLIAPSINPGEQFGLFALLAFVLMSGQALYDTCTDGLALDTTPKEEEGTIQGIMVGGRALGVVLISAALGGIVQNFSWSGAFWLLALLTLLPLPLVLWAREPERAAGRRFEWRAFGAFTRWPVIALGLVGALYSLVINAANQIVNPFLQNQFGINYASAGLFTTIWGVGVAVGGLTGGRLVDTLGHRRSLVTAVGLSLVGVLLLAFTPSIAAAVALVVLFGLAFGYYETVYFAISMNLTDPRIAASMFAILMAVANVGTGIGLGASGALVDAIGFRLTFAVVAALNLFVLPLVPGVFRKPASAEATPLVAK